MAHIGLNTFSNDPPHDRLALVFSTILTAIGVVMMTWSAVHYASQPWDLSPDNYAWGKPAASSPVTGDHYVIEVAGKKHTCYRGRQKLPHETAPILYDPDEPSRCRAADAMDGISEYEQLLLTMGTGAMFLGAALLMAYLAEPREKWARNDPGPLLRPRLMWAARITVALAVIVPLTISAAGRGFAVTPFGPDPPSPDEFPRVEVSTTP